MNADDPDAQRRRDELIRGLQLLEQFRTGTLPPNADTTLMQSRLDVLNGVSQPPGNPTAAPHLRLIRGGKE
jgi:hypothetical protein